MKFAVIPANGIGDGLIMLIAAHHLKTLGHSVTIFHNQLPSFGNWLEKGDYLPLPRDFSGFDALLLQHNNTELAIQIAQLRKQGQAVYILFTTYHPMKHAEFDKRFDYAFDINCTMVENTCLAMKKLFGLMASMSNGCKPPPGLIHRKYMKRVLLHPTSGKQEKNWPREKFIALFDRLKQWDYQPVLIVSPEERDFWPDAPELKTLEDLASYIYESGFLIGNDSGPGHIASYLSIPHIIISPSKKNMRLWRPGWHPGEIVVPPPWIPNFKGFRLREKKWKQFITTKGVLNRFISISK
jgi:heptosyltransferase III